MANHGFSGHREWKLNALKGQNFVIAVKANETTSPVHRTAVTAVGEQTTESLDHRRCRFSKES